MDEYKKIKCTEAHQRGKIHFQIQQHGTLPEIEQLDRPVSDGTNDSLKFMQHISLAALAWL